MFRVLETKGLRFRRWKGVGFRVTRVLLSGAL